MNKITVATKGVRADIGTVVIRTRHKRGGEQRAFIKVAQPNKWKLLAVHVWESLNGPVPRGMGVHHKDRNKLNDSPDNLELMSKARHLAEHRPEFKTKAIAGLIAARRKTRWSTKSKTKRTGRPPTNDPQVVASAVAEYRRGGASLRTVAAKHGISFGALSHAARRA